MSVALVAVDERVERQLVALREAVNAISLVDSVDLAKEIRDQVRAIEVYSQKRDGFGAVSVKATEARIRCERHIGKLLGEPATPQEKGAKGGRGRKKSGGATSFPKQEANRLRLMASLSDERFDAVMADGRAKGEVTAARVITEAKSERSKREHQERVRVARESELPARCYRSFEELHAALADGRESPFGAVYADPPWAYSNTKTRGNAEKQYTVSGSAFIEAMPVEALAAQDSFLFMWATSPLLPECVRVVSAWGFTYKASIVWDKDTMGLGNYARVQHEFLLIGVRGEPKWTRRDVRSVVRGGAGAHSVKPDLFRDLVRSVCAGPYCELFARVPSRDFACMGNEIHGKPGDAPLFVNPQDQMFAEGA